MGTRKALMQAFILSLCLTNAARPASAAEDSPEPVYSPYARESFPNGRIVDPETGRAPALASTVDVTSATYANSIGESQLAALWRDQDFNPDQPAFYYLRVLEIPTPRWTTYDAAFFGSPLPDKVPAEIQERAYTSPIWYKPNSQEYAP